MNILKVLVGSRAHGLHTDSSDWDYRGVFVRPTSEILSLGAKPQHTSWVEADKAAGEKADDTSWELGHFLSLATHCNPTILEVFSAPIIEADEIGHTLRALFPAIWNPTDVRNAFMGYGINQRKKFLEDKDTRPAKYACAYLRVLFQGHELLRTGVLPVDMRDSAVFDTLKRWRSGEYTKGEVIDTCLSWQSDLNFAHEAHAAEQAPNLARVNAFLLNVRRENW